MAVGRHEKKTSSNRRVKSNARQEESTLGPKMLSLVGKHTIGDAIVSWIGSPSCNGMIKSG